MKTASKKEQVKIFGTMVTVGTKKHAAMLQQKKIFDQNAKGETGF